MLSFLIILFALTLIYLSIAERFRSFSKLIAVQGFLLFGIAFLELTEVHLANLIFIMAETLIFKAFLIPFLLTRIIKASGVTKVHRQAIPGFYLLLFSIFTLLLSVILAHSLVNPFVNTIYMTIALFTLFTGLLLIVTHKLIISHLIGFLIIENAVFIFSLAVGNEMPMLINIGILLEHFCRCSYPRLFWFTPQAAYKRINNVKRLKCFYCFL